MMRARRAICCILAIMLTVTQCVYKTAIKTVVYTSHYLGQHPPGMTPEVFAPGIISQAGRHLHSCVAFSPDGREIYYTVLASEPRRQFIIYRHQYVDGQWTGPEVAPFSGVYDDDSPAFTPDGKRLYFSSTRPVSAEDSTGDLDFWYVERQGKAWGTPVHAGSVINTDDTDFRLSFAHTGNVFLSSGHAAGGVSTFDIFEIRNASGQWQVPHRLDGNVNTDWTEQIAVVSPQEDWLIYYRYPKDALDATGLYISFKDEDGRWMRGVNMGPLFNAPSDKVTQAASLSPDGKYLFFLRRYEEAIYWVDSRAVEALRAQALRQSDHH